MAVSHVALAVHWRARARRLPHSSQLLTPHSSQLLTPPCLCLHAACRAPQVPSCPIPTEDEQSSDEEVANKQRPRPLSTSTTE
jgi:hypothetical protein